MQKRTNSQFQTEIALKKLLKSQTNNKILIANFGQCQRLQKQFKYLESINLLKVILQQVKKKSKGNDSILLIYLIYKHLGFMNLELSLNNQAIKYLLKAQYMLFKVINSMNDQKKLKEIIKSTYRIQQFNQVFKIINNKLKEKEKIGNELLSILEQQHINTQISQINLKLLPELSGVQAKIGMNYFYFGDFSISLILLDEIKQTLENNTQISCEEYASTLENLGNYYRFKYEDDQAIQLLKQSGDIRLIVYGVKSEESARSKQSMAHLLMDMNRLTTALTLADEALQIRILLYGNRHPRVAACMFLKAEILFKNNEYAQSEEIAHNALRINESTLGVHYVQTANCHLLLGQLHAKTRHPISFTLFFDKAMEVFIISYGSMHSQVAQLYSLYASAYLDIQQYQLALPYFEKTLEIYNFLRLDINIAMTLLDLAQCNMKLKMYRTAFINYQQSLNIHLERYGPNDYVAIKIQKLIDEVYQFLED